VADIHTIAITSISGCSSKEKQHLLRGLVYEDGLDIPLLEEVTTDCLDSIPEYDIHYNIGTTKRGKAITARSSLHLDGFETLLSRCVWSAGTTTV
jgi:hypothetical protein